MRLSLAFDTILNNMGETGMLERRVPSVALTISRATTSPCVGDQYMREVGRKRYALQVQQDKQQR